MDDPVKGAAGTDEAEVKPTEAETKPMKYKPFYLKTKTEDMIKYGKKAVAMFPRRERQTADAIRETMLEMYRLTIMIERKYYKKTTLQELDTDLEILRHFVRLAADPDYYDERIPKKENGKPVKDKDGHTVTVKMQPPLPFKKYQVWSEMLDEIGKIIGGYMKTLKG